MEQAAKKIAIVTGANIGVGLNSTIGLVSKNYKVIMACRNIHKAERAKAEILQKFPAADLEILPLNLSSLQSVREFASLFKSKYQHLHILLNNAGIMVPPFSKTEDGFESQMGVNYLGHFLLTSLLFPVLNQSQDARIISLSSIAHKQGKIDFSNFNSEKKFSKIGAYSQSKLACLMFAFELQRRINAAGSSVKSLAVHPGVSNTNLGQFLPKIGQWMFAFIGDVFLNSPQQAAESSLYAALNDNVKGGDYFGPKGFMEMRGKIGEAFSTKMSHNPEIAKKLWEFSEQLVNEKFKV